MDIELKILYATLVFSVLVLSVPKILYFFRSASEGIEFEKSHKLPRKEEMVTVCAPQMMEGKTTSPATLVRELCKTIGEALIEIAKTAKDMAMGEPEKKELTKQ